MGSKNFKTALILVFSSIALFFSVPRVFAATMSINDLIEATTLYDGQTITIEAELIGEALDRGEYSWLNVNDGTNAIGIWVNNSQIESLVFFGDYDTIGDTVAITGVFHQSCPEHGGDVDIHAESISVIHSGFRVEHPLSVSKLIWGVSLLGAAALCGFYYLWTRPQKLKKKTISAPQEE